MQERVARIVVSVTVAGKPRVAKHRDDRIARRAPPGNGGCQQVDPSDSSGDVEAGIRLRRDQQVRLDDVRIRLGEERGQPAARGVAQAITWPSPPSTRIDAPCDKMSALAGQERDDAPHLVGSADATHR